MTGDLKVMIHGTSYRLPYRYGGEKRERVLQALRRPDVRVTGNGQCSPRATSKCYQHRIGRGDGRNRSSYRRASTSATGASLDAAHWRLARRGVGGRYAAGTPQGVGIKRILPNRK